MLIQISRYFRFSIFIVTFMAVVVFSALGFVNWCVVTVVAIRDLVLYLFFSSVIFTSIREILKSGKMEQNNVPFPVITLFSCLLILLWESCYYNFTFS